MRADADRWFRTSTSVGGSWDRRHVMECKRDTKVSVVLPARNEAATVGGIVEAIRTQLMLAIPLVDEVVVVDSGSVDATGLLAAEAGARVVRQCDLLPRWGDRDGKGEALWKSLYETTGDVVAFVDADLSSFDPQFVVGLLGPLLTNPSVLFVKGFYDRPLNTGETLLPAGGGRVTEMLARPLLNVHWPELAGFVQPLAGEYAGRRHLLEQIPFVSGYGVEIAMLVDVLQAVGLAGMAQVDLGTRRHRNSGDLELGRMAGQVYLAMLSRLERHGRSVSTEEASEQLVQFLREGEGFEPLVSDVGITERPPMLTVPEYLHRRRLVEEPT
jgi:glucosyl-3-phosphoglycerate synthase